MESATTTGTRLDTCTRLAVPEDVLVRDLGGESVLLNLRTEAYFGLDEVGTRMWKALTRGLTVGAAFRELSEAYDVAPATLERDLFGLTEKLLSHALLEIHAE